MMRQYYKLFLLCLFLISGNSFLFSSSPKKEKDCHKKEITIVITDSGLGGLSVMDIIAKKFSVSGQYKKVNLIFVNALFEAGKGYNALSSRDEKIDTFDKVLWGIEENYHPDIILIACNTLSVIFQETAFVQNSDTRVVGIVEAGVEMIKKSLANNPHSSVIITGTETTITENSHKKALMENGIPENRIISQACPQLQSYIEQDPDGEDTGMLISIYIEEALSGLSEDSGPVFLSLNCSHFAYSSQLWREAFEYLEHDLADVLNPNETMGNFLFPEDKQGVFKKIKVNLSVVSKIEILNKNSMITVFEDTAPSLAEALNNYIIAPDLF